MFGMISNTVGTLVIILSIMVLALFVMWFFLPWFLLSKLNRIISLLEKISKKS